MLVVIWFQHKSSLAFNMARLDESFGWEASKESQII